MTAFEASTPAGTRSVKVAGLASSIPEGLRRTVLPLTIRAGIDVAGSGTRSIESAVAVGSAPAGTVMDPPPSTASVPPWAPMVPLEGGATVIVAVPSRDPEVARMVTGPPAATAIAWPVVDTAATDGLSLVQVI